MKNILKITILVTLLVFVLLTTASCKNIMDNLPFGSDEEPHNHSFGDWAVTQNATCTEKGLQERTCSCGEKETQEMSARGHKQVVDPAVSSTCTTDGLGVGMHCETCGEVLLAQEVTPAAHVWTQTELVRAATCFVPGEEKRVCRICEAEETAPIAVLEHNFVQDEETKLYSCSICDARIFAGHLYAAFEENYSWVDAYQLCEDMGGHLVTVTSAHEQAIITDIMRSELRVGQYYWTGGIRLTGQFHWITGEPLEYQNWKSGYPSGNKDFVSTQSHNVSSNNLGAWYDDRFTNWRGFVCEWDFGFTECEHIFTEWETTCEPTCWNEGEQYRICTYCGVKETEVLSQLTHTFAFVEEIGMTCCEHCNAVKYNGHIYVLFTDECYWFEAYSRCEALGGHLATITSEKEQTFILSYLRAFDYSKLLPFLGGYSDGKQWHWVTGEPFEYTYWNSGEPNNSSNYEWILHQHNAEGNWNDLSPLTYAPYLCEFEYEE